ncbi:cellulose biosynthesis protein BcsR [Aeromonas caviae]|uniref:cellulose biosynthesis protein BcsR n=1 Tax=Aeromonas caviae TaxID=648 RepID=UPI002B49A34C|nr:cellulose biosynthesis protein BcsR [Aeromonas caviae]
MINDVAMVQQAFGVSLSYQDIAARERLAALCARFPLLAEVAVKGPEGTGEGRSA